MDDAAERRGRPCPHRVYGEAAATLGALVFVNQGYALLWETLAPLPAARQLAASRLVNECLGLSGLLNGQARDLHFASGAGGEAEVLAVAEGKTVPLIRLSLVLPALVAGAERPVLDRLERLSTLWGLAYQILDDFKDCLMDQSETGKTTAQDEALGRPNLPAAAGVGGALERVEGLVAEARQLLAGLGGEVPGRWSQLTPVQGLLERELASVRRRLVLPACA
jgi:geranylgeranyl pyrophosphate synthase